MKKTKPKINIKKVSNKKIVDETENLGLLDLGKNQVYAMPLPSNCGGIIVNYSRKQAIRISCKIPAKTYEVGLAKWKVKKIKIAAPALLMSANYWDIPKRGSHPIEGFYILGLNNRAPGRIWAAPYIISNVYKTGRICFGSFSPTNLRSAYNLFWATPFNSELIEETDRWRHYDTSISKSYSRADVAGIMKEYKKGIFGNQDWEDYTDEICGDEFWASPTGSGAILVTDNKKLLRKIPKVHWRKHGDYPIFIAKITRFKKSWGFNSGTVNFRLPHKNITFNIYDNKFSKANDSWNK